MIWQEREDALTGPVRCASGGVKATGASPGIVSSSADRPRGWGPPEGGAVGRLDAWGLQAVAAGGLVVL